MTPPKPARDAPPRRPRPEPGVEARPGRNPGTALLADAVAELQVDTERIEARAAGIREAVRAGGDGEAHGLLRVVGLLDLTTLAEDDTQDTVRSLCRDAVRPVSEEVRRRLDIEGSQGSHVAAVCVLDRFVPAARRALEGSPVRVAAVAAGFPRPLASLDERLGHVRKAVRAGADEVDLVVTREHALERNWAGLYTEVKALREASGDARLKAILAAGDLDSLNTVARAGLVCCMAGADFIKTSTGRERVNATLPIGLAMTAAIGRYLELAGAEVGLKPAGGIRTPGEALAWVRLVADDLGPAWLHPGRFRIGASSLLRGLRTRLRALADAPTEDRRGT